MSVSPLDALVQIATPPRPLDPPSRGSENGRAFGPALEQAYNEERPREANHSDADEPEYAEGPAPATSRDAEDEHAAADADAPIESAAPAEEEAEKDDDADAVEISEEAVAAATAEGAPSADVVKATAVLNAAVVEGPELVVAESEAACLEATPARSEAANGEGEPTGDHAAAAKEGSVKRAAAALGAAGALLEKPVAALESHAAEAAKRGKAHAATEVRPQKVSETSADQVQAAEEQAADVTEATALVEGDDSSPSKSDAADRREARVADDSRAETVKTAAARQAESIPTAVDNSATRPDSAVASGDNDAVSAPRAAADASNVAPAGGRPSPTLDRLAARALRTEGAGQSDNGPPVDRPRFVQRVEGAIRAAQQRDGRVQVRLSPPELGNLRIELAVQNGVLTARLEAETPAARNALLDNLPALRERLAQQEIRVEKFDVDVRRDSGGNAGSGGPHDRPTGQSDSGRQEGRGRAPAPTRIAAPTARAVAATLASDTSLDVRI